MPEFKPPKDCQDQPVGLGDKVRLICVPKWLIEKLPSDEVERIESMIGEVFIVDEIDEYGGVWVEKVWDSGNGTLLSHSLSLNPEEMELIQKK